LAAGVGQTFTPGEYESAVTERYNTRLFVIGQLAAQRAYEDVEEFVGGDEAAAEVFCYWWHTHVVSALARTMIAACRRRQLYVKRTRSEMAEITDRDRDYAYYAAFILAKWIDTIRDGECGGGAYTRVRPLLSYEATRAIVTEISNDVIPFRQFINDGLYARLSAARAAALDTEQQQQQSQQSQA